jgi:hypothetical protein
MFKFAAKIANSVKVTGRRVDRGDVSVARLQFGERRTRGDGCIEPFHDV